MAVFIRSVGCSCPECGPDPCIETACFCETSPQVIASADTQSANYNTYGSFPADRDIDIEVGVGPGSGNTGRGVIKADGTTMYDSGCLSNGLYFDVATVPAGTITLEIIATAPCSTGADSTCSVTISCA
jgi:hypothetical protein